MDRRNVVASSISLSVEEVDRVTLGLAAAEAILELVRFAVEGNNYTQAASAPLQASGSRAGATYPDPVCGDSISSALYAAGLEIAQARGLIRK